MFEVLPRASRIQGQLIMFIEKFNEIVSDKEAISPYDNEERSRYVSLPQQRSHTLPLN